MTNPAQTLPSAIPTSLIFYMLININTGQVMGEDAYGLLAMDPASAKKGPKLLTGMQLAESHQAAMNCLCGRGWEVATLDLAKAITQITDVTSQMD